MNDRIQHYCRSRKYSGLVIEGGLDYLLVRWSTLVRQLRAPYTRGIDEFTSDLGGRAIIEEVLPLATEDERKMAEAALSDLDAAFRELTVPSPVRVSRRREGDPDHWWYYRLPAGLQLPGGGGRFGEFQKHAGTLLLQRKKSPGASRSWSCWWSSGSSPF